MNTLSYIFNLFNAPTAVKLLVALMITTLAPLAVAVTITQIETTDVNNRAISGYLIEAADRYADRLDSALSQAARGLESIARNRLYRSQMINMLLSDENDFVRPSVVNLFENRLIESELFTRVQLLDRDGRIAADTVTGQIGRDLSATSAFRAGLNAATLGNTQAISFIQLQDETPAVQFTQLVSSFEGEVVGYIIAELNLDTMILQNLQAQTGFVPVFAYAFSRNNLLFVPDEFRGRAVLSLRENSFSTPRGNISYISPLDSQRTLGVYQPTPSNRFTVVVETLGTISLVPPPLAVISDNLPLFMGLFVVLAVVLALLLAAINYPVRDLRPAMRAMANDNYDVPVRLSAQRDELGLLARDFVNLRARIRSIIQDQNERVRNLTRDIQATQEVSRYAAFQREAQELMDNVVNLILRQFPNIYHAQVFIIDDDNRYALLRASTGKAGEQLLARGHRLAVGSTSVIGQVTQRGVTIVARDTATSEVHRRNEFLPDTRAELAIPLRIGDRVFGALDVQSRDSNTFTADQINILETMADQIAISLDNARLYQESLQRLREVAEANRSATQSEWQDYLNEQRTAGLSQSTGLQLIDHEPLRLRAIAEGQTVIGETTDRNTVPFAVPIRLREHTLGAVVWELPSIAINTDRIQLAEELVNRLAITLDNARLFQTSRQSAARERIVNEIAAQLAGKTDVEEILRTAVREVGQALRLPEVQIRLNVGRKPAHANGNHANGAHLSADDGAKATTEDTLT